MNLSSIGANGLPIGMSLLRGNPSVVTKDGARMIRAAEEAELLIRLPEALPESFTIEMEIIPKLCCAPADVSFEGTPQISRDENASMHVVWQTETIIAVGGGKYSQVDMPPDLQPVVASAPTTIGASFQGTAFKLFTNGRLVLDSPNRQFVRGRVLRVSLGGACREQDENCRTPDDADKNTVYLSKLRVAATSGAIASATNADLANVMSTGATGTVTEATGTRSPGTVVGSTPTVRTPTNPTVITGTVTPGVAAPRSVATATAASSPTNPLPVVSRTDTGGTATQQQAMRGVTTSPNTQTEPRSGFTVTVTMASAGPLVSWPVVADASGYTVSRTKIGDVCCNNDSGRGYLPASPWQDKPLPSSGTYSYLVLATTPAGVVRAETQFSYTAPAPVDAVLSPMTPANGMATTSGDPPATYRVTMTGFRVARPTSEPIIADDGRFDEAYAAAAVVLFNRKDSAVLSHTVVRTREYGDVGNGKRGDRIKGGSATPDGGIWSPPGGDRVPTEFDPSGSAFPDPKSDQFPLLVWEGGLNAGIEALLIVPTIWDRDLDSTPYETWKNPWVTGTLTRFVTLTEVVDETKTAGVVPIVADALAGLPFILPMPEAAGHIKDRPIGVQLDPPLPLPPIAVIYKDRHVMLTREKLADLAPGASKMVSLPFGETQLSTATGAMYTLYLRIQRIQ